jgi:uncharacterized protein YjiK
MKKLKNGEKRIMKIKPMIFLSWESGFSLFFIITAFLALNTCSNSEGVRSAPAGVNEIGYDLTEPDKTNILPVTLREISGITVLDASTVACVQDENGIVFIYDIVKSEITKMITFGRDGDYEGITLVNDTLYILRSDGTLLKIKNSESSSFASITDLNGIKAENNEGLCYDYKTHWLLIAPKEKNLKGPGFKENHLIYGFDLLRDSMLKKPVLKIDLADVTRYIEKNNVAALKKANKKGKKDKKNTQEFDFKPSEISVHPITGKIFILSGEALMLFVFDRNGTIEFAEKLDPLIFTMPEGLAFFENGDMLISNEAGNRYPTILRFNYSMKSD